MIGGFKRRAPWAAGLISLFFGPSIGMFYLGRGWTGLAYFFAPWVVGAVLLAALHFEVIRAPFDVIWWPAVIVVHLAGVVHAVIVASRGFQRPRWYARWYALLAIYAAPLLTAFVLRTFVLEPFTIPAGSMSPTVNPGDYVLVSKRSGRIYERGDLIAHLFPEDGRIIYLKRVIGLPGDTVQYREGRLYINGEMADRTSEGVWRYVSRSGEAVGVPVYRETLAGGRSYRILEIDDGRAADDTRVYSVPPGHVFVLGDNRDDSRDSRYFGAVPADLVVGRPVLALWDGPPAKFGVRRLE